MDNLTIVNILKSYKEKAFSCKELTAHYIDKAKKDSKGINPFINILEEYALNRADEVDKNMQKGEGAPLLGIPLAIKDNINIKGIETTCASKILTGYYAPFDAFVIEKLKEAGALFIAKANLDEFAMGSSTENSSYGLTKNPHDTTRAPGGSSGGSVASVACDFAAAALGSDTGGSIRQPSAFCGTVGLKPTYGRVSRYGLVAYGSSLDQIGPVTKTVKDASLLLSVISGHDKNDSTSAEEAVEDYFSRIEDSIKGKKIGIPKEYFEGELDSDVKKITEEALGILKELGCQLIDISLSHTKYGVPVYYIIATSEASSNLARFDGIRYGRRSDADDILDVFMKSRQEGFGKEVKRRIMLGTYSLSSGYYDAYYLKALKARTLIKNDFIKAFEDIDIIASPVTPTSAFKIGEKTEDPIKMYLSDIFTINANLAGVPAISVPVKKNDNGLPVGIQFMANHFAEASLLNTARKFEEAAGYDYKI